MAGKGILGRKLGMTQVWDADNRVVPVTVIQAGPCRVVQLKTPERDGYAAVQLAFGATKPQRLSKGELGHLAKAGVDAQRDLVELRVEDLTGYEVGMEISADIFGAGERVDVTGVSKGKGFAGVMKRHNFKGQGASHGNHKSHRVPGAIGACATPARVFKGTRMAGQMGARKVTTLNLEVVEGDAERGLLLIRGSIPGANGTVVMVRNAVKGPKVTFEPPAAREPVVEEPVADEAPVPDEPAPDGPVADEAKADEPAADADDEGGASE